MEGSRSAFKILTGKPNVERLLGRFRRGCEVNIRIYIEEIGVNTRNCINSAQYRDYLRNIVNTALNLRAP